MQRQECLVGPRDSEDTNVAGAGGVRRKMEGHEDREELRPDLGGPSRLQWKTPPHQPHSRCPQIHLPGSTYSDLFYNKQVHCSMPSVP